MGATRLNTYPIQNRLAGCHQDIEKELLLLVLIQHFVQQPLLCLNLLRLPGAFAGVGPDAHLLGGLDEVFAEVWVSDVYEHLSALPCGAAFEVGGAVLGDDEVGGGSRGRYDGAFW